MRKAETIRRLSKLAELLDYVPDERFNYQSWVGSDYKGEKDLSCGTTACALGWATTIPEFQAEGLRLVKDVSGERYCVALGVLDPDFDFYRTPFEAAMEAFGITDEEARWLFTPLGDELRREDVVTSGGADYEFPDKLSEDPPDGGASPKEVAAHIRNFLLAKFGFEPPKPGPPDWIKEILEHAGCPVTVD